MIPCISHIVNRNLKKKTGERKCTFLSPVYVPLCFAVKQVLHGHAGQVVIHDGVELFPHRQRQALGRALADSRHATAAMLPSVLCSTSATVMSLAGRLRR